jgi:putative CocE/NonD family hydrolase
MSDANVRVGVPAEMSDGARLRCDVWLPTAEGTYPTLLQRTAYDRTSSLTSIVLPGLEPLEAVRRGFAVVIQDTRGRYASEGRFRTFADDARDGVDTIAWIRGQPFSNGDVCTYGLSHNGLKQLQLASERPEGLRAIAPAQTAADWHDVWTYQAGAFQLGFCLLWALQFLAPAELERRAATGEDVRDLARAFRELSHDPWAAYQRLPTLAAGPLADVFPEYIEWIRHPQRDGFCAALGLPADRLTLDVPALQITGWYDLFLPGTLDAFRRLRRSSAGDRQRLVIGPWAHGVFGEQLGEVDFGPASALAALDPTRLQLDFFETVLAGDAPPGTPVLIFVMGANVWRSEEDWPLARARERRLYLHADGLLGAAPPRHAQPPDRYDYDPRSAVPTCGGASFLPGLATGTTCGPRNQSTVERRSDVLVYTSKPLEEDWEVTGDVAVSLYASTSAVDTDFTAKLVDVHADGRPLSVCDGLVRARYRYGPTPTLLSPGAIERYEIQLGATSMVFRAGHRIRLEISSSNFPRFDRNPNVRGVIAETPEARFEVARQSVFHDPDRASFLALPVVRV